MPKIKLQSNNLHKAKIRDFGRVVTGKTPPTKNQEYYGSKYPFITPTDISDNSIFVDAPERYLSEEGAIKVASSKLPANSVCYTCIASVGKIAITKEKSFTNQQINSIIVDSQKADYRYVFYLLKNITPEIKGMVGGAASPIINKSAFENIDVDALNAQAQKGVADILFTYDQLIENNTKRIKILEGMAQAIYKEWFSMPHKEWQTTILRSVIESYIGGGWGKENPDSNYSNPAYVIRGTDIPNTTTGDISSCPLRYHRISNLRNRVLQSGDLVFEVSGGSKGQPVGRSLLITDGLLNQFGQDVICASFCKLIRPNQNKISPFQLYEQALIWYGNGVIEKYQVQSTGISNFRFESFIDEEKVILPPEKIREKFDHFVSPLFDEIYSLGNQNQNLCQARDLLLPKLVTGEIEV